MAAILQLRSTVLSDAARPWVVLVLAACLALLAAGLGLRKPGPALQASPVPVASKSVPPRVEVTRLLKVSPQAATQLNASQPFATLHPVSASPFRFEGSDEDRGRATDCLAAAAWYEAGDDPTGETAVVQVVLNRARHPAFPATVCGVVFQGSERVTGCQFTFTCDGALLRTPSIAAWDRARAIAAAALGGQVDARVGWATHYHTDWVVPYWRGSLDKIAQVRTHLFYRWPGFWGTSAAFRASAGRGEPLKPALARLSPAHAAAVVPETMLPLPAAGAPAAQHDRPLPAAVMVSGVTEKSLRKAVVRGQSVASDRFFIEVDPQTFPGSYATAAVALCRDRPTCTVLGWRDASRMGVQLPLGQHERGALTFYYAKDAGGDRALWNCVQVQRSNKGQCLPEEDGHLAALVG